MESVTEAVLTLAEKHIGDGNFRIRNGQVIAKYCPFCHGGDNGDGETFAIGLYNGAWQCLRGSCKKSGSFRDLAEHFGMNASASLSAPISFKETKKNYVKPNKDMIKDLSEKAEMYFALRRISKDTLTDFHIGTDDKGNIVFPFYKDGTLTYVKMRKPEKRKREDKTPKEWQLENTEPILFGMDNISFNKPIIITEGEIDALSVYEAGYHNVLSVPCGCQNLNWIETCWDFLENCQQFILFGDNDEPGTAMIELLSKRLGEDRCLLMPEYPPLIINEVIQTKKCKDANEILVCYGSEFLRQLIDEARPTPIKGVLNLAQVEDIDPNSIPRIYTNIPALDRAIGGLAEGGVTVLSGKRGEGKSTIGGNLLLNAIEQGHKVAAYSGELPATKFREWIMLQATESNLIGITVDERTGKRVATVDKEIKKRICEYIDNKFFLFDNAYVEEANQTEAIMKVFTMCARKFACKLFLVDNMMSALCSPEEENKAQARFMSQIKAFAGKYKCHVIVVCHPRKTRPQDQFSNDDVAGSSVLTNLADNVLAIEKPNIRVTKNRDFGETPYILCSYDPTNRHIFQTGAGDKFKYSWNHEGIKEPETQACSFEEFAVTEGKPPMQGTSPTF